ncbi:MAG: alpha/beta hydrolase [bacterium]|nr:alpha/beta hydrolase [bacterium]
MHYGIRHPDRLRSLILCSTTASVSAFGEMRETYEAARAPGEAEALGEMYSSEALQNGDPKAYEEFWRLYFRPYFADPSLADGLDLLFTPNTIRNSSLVAGGVLGSIGEFDLHEDLEAITCPTLVLHGDADPMPLRYAEQIRDSIAGAELVVAPDVGHWLFVDGTELFRSSILGFLAGIGAPIMDENPDKR